MNKKLTEKQEFYLSMVDEETNKIINQLKVRKDTKTNIKLVYGFMKDAIKKFDYRKLQNTGRQSNTYKLRQTSCDKPFIASYKTISSQVGISNNSVGICVQHLENLGIIEVIKDALINKDAINDNTSCDTNTISNTISNNILDNISDLDYNEPNNKTNLNNNKINLYYKRLIKENRQMREQIKELTEQMELLIEKVNKLEDYTTEQLNGIKQQIEELQAQRTEQPSMNVDIKQLKSNIQSFWDSWNRFKDALYHGDVENKEHHYQTYINKVKELYKDPTKALQQMEEQYSKATSKKSNQSNSNFVVKDELKVYMDLENNSTISHALTQWLQQVNQKLAEIPTEYREQAKTYYTNYMFKVLADKPKDALIRHWNEGIPNLPIN